MDQVVPATTAGSVIDSGLLARAGGDRELLCEVIGLFLDDGPMLIEGIRRGLADGDSAAVRSAAHSLAGSAANFDAAEVTTLSRELEFHAAAQNTAESKRTFAPLLKAFMQLLNRLSLARMALECAS